MTVLDERVRSSLYRQLAADYGEEEASAMVESVATYHNELATKQDLGLLRADTQLLGAELRKEMATEFAAVRSEMATMSAELRSEIAALKDEIHDAGRNIIVWTIPTMATLTAMSFVAAQLT